MDVTIDQQEINNINVPARQLPNSEKRKTNSLDRNLTELSSSSLNHPKIKTTFKSKLRSSYALLSFYRAASSISHLKPPPPLPPPPLTAVKISASSKQPVRVYLGASSVKQSVSSKGKTSTPIKRQNTGTKEENCDANYEKDVDSGYAWIILAVMFLINSTTFGTARAYGLIFEKLAREDEQSRAEAALPFTMMGAIENMAGPLTGYLLTRTRSWRITVMLGSCLITLAHLLTAFCLSSQIGQVLSMGLMCGLGLSLVSISFFQINNAYFVRYRSRAFGLGLTGAAFGTFYISPLCQYVLNKYNTKLCYLLLGLILFPNIPLSLLLRPKKASTLTNQPKEEICSISKKLDQKLVHKRSLSKSILEVIRNPIFHLIWLTQLLFCWFNFVFGMIIIDFGMDRGLDSSQVSQLIPIWALGQLVGRLVLGSLVDLRLISYRNFTVICFGSISLATYILNNVQSEEYENILISILVFVLSVFISNLYILFNGLILNHMDKSLTAFSIGISSFIGSFFLLPRAYIIGHYRDTFGNYDAMLTMFTYVSLAAALVWFLLPGFGSRVYSFITIISPTSPNKVLTIITKNNSPILIISKPDIKS